MKKVFIIILLIAFSTSFTCTGMEFAYSKEVGMFLAIHSNNTTVHSSVEIIGESISENEMQAILKKINSLQLVEEISLNLTRDKVVLLKNPQNYYFYKEEWIEEDKKRKASRIAVFSQGEIIKYLI